MNSMQIIREIGNLNHNLNRIAEALEVIVNNINNGTLSKGRCSEMPPDARKPMMETNQKDLKIP